MELFCLCLKTCAALDGEGARLYGGRWNSAGRAVIYTSERLSLTVLEYLVHVEPDNLPDGLTWLKIHLPDDIAIEKFAGAEAPQPPQACRFGDKWIDQAKTLALSVPSAVIPVERNILLNPHHAKMSRVQIIDQQPFSFDSRLFKQL
jgi:RES domain-containing protein